MLPCVLSAWRRIQMKVTVCLPWLVYHHISTVNVEAGTCYTPSVRARTIGVPVHVCLALAVISALCMSGVYIDLPYLMAEIRMEVRHLARACIRTWQCLFCVCYLSPARSAPWKGFGSERQKKQTTKMKPKGTKWNPFRLHFEYPGWLNSEKHSGQALEIRRRSLALSEEASKSFKHMQTQPNH